MATPSSRRREGRNAFCPGDDPELLCPYNSDWSKADWLEGWDEAKSTCDEEQKERDEKNQAWDSLSCSCPWSDGDGGCQAIPGNSCRDENCAPLYFINNQNKE